MTDEIPTASAATMPALPLAPASDARLRGFLSRLTRKENLAREEATELMHALLDAASSDAQIAATLIALAVKGETVEELAGMADAMRSRMVRVVNRHGSLIDTAGTGSSAVKTFNVSTATAFVIAGAGLPVAKHGNRAATSRTGSADVLSALGVEVNVSPEVSARCRNEIDICFMFAPLYHGTTARAAGVRRELGVHTAFNLLGPLTNPAAATHQVVGVWSRSLVEPVAQTLALLGTIRAWVVHGLDGLDEITLSDQTKVAECQDGRVRTFEIGPEDFGMERRSLDGLRADDAHASAETILQILNGQRHDAARELVIINAATALYVGGMTTDLNQARGLAEASIDSGAARTKLQQLRRLTNESNN